MREAAACPRAALPAHVPAKPALGLDPWVGTGSPTRTYANA